jgi:hypothetical protein
MSFIEKFTPKKYLNNLIFPSTIKSFTPFPHKNPPITLFAYFKGAFTSPRHLQLFTTRTQKCVFGSFMPPSARTEEQSEMHSEKLRPGPILKLSMLIKTATLFPKANLATPSTNSLRSRNCRTGLQDMRSRLCSRMWPQYLFMHRSW